MSAVHGDHGPDCEGSLSRLSTFRRAATVIRFLLVHYMGLESAAKECIETPELVAADAHIVKMCMVTQFLDTA